MADPTLRIRIAGDLTAIKATLATLQKDFANVGAQITKTGNQGATSMSRMEKSVLGAQRAVASLVTSFVALQAIRTVVGFGDQFAQLNGVLKLATKSTEEFVAAQKGVLKIANDTRTPVKETADTYAALERTTRSVGLSQGELLVALETVNKSIALTPVNAQAAQAALVQFGQALGGNFKNGAQELNSILEQTPGLAISIARGLGVEVTALKKMGEEGKLNTELVVRGLIRIRDQVDKDFQQVPKTISGVLQTIKNDLLVTIGGAGMQPLVESLEELRRIVSDPAVVTGLTAIASAIVQISAAAVGAVSGTANLTKFVAESLAAFINGVNPDDLVRLSEKIADLQAQIKDFETLGSVGTAPGLDRLVELRAELEKVQAVYDAGRKAAEAAQIATERAGKAEAAAAAKAAAEAEKKFKDAQANLTAKSATSAALTQNATLIKDATDRTIAQLDRLYAEGKIKFVDYVNAKRDATLEALDAARQLAEFEAVNADTADARVKAQAKIAVLQRDQAEAVNAASREREEGTKQLKRDLEDIQDKIAEASGNGLATTTRALEREKEELLKNFANDPGASVLINRLFDVELAHARAESIKTEADRLIADLQAKEQAVSAQVSAGVISQATGEEQLRAARQATIDQLIQQRDALQAVYDAAPSEEVLEAIREFNREIGEIGVRNATGLQRAMIDLRNQLTQLQADFTGDAVSALTNSLSNFFTSILDGSKSAGDALRDFVRSFAQAMLDIAARALALFLTLQLLDAFYPGLGEATLASMGGGAAGQGFGGIRTAHTGGVINGGGTKRYGVNPALFGAAPRYHMGGVAGLAPNEVPAILERGEEVLAKGDPRNVMNGGGQAVQVNNRVINVFDQNFVADQMDSAAGEKVLLNFIGKNPNRIKQLLG